MSTPPVQPVTLDNIMNLDSIFITSGVHKSKIIDEKLMDKLLDEHNVNANYFQKELTW